MYNTQLDTFIMVSDSGSFSKAAEALYISPTAVIKQINLLEARLDLCLFLRSHRGLRLTEAGESLYRDIKYMIQYSKDSLIRARSSMKQNENIIHIGTSIMTPSQFLMELCPQIYELCSELKFKLVPFENTPESEREILINLGQNIDLIPGIFDSELLRQRNCRALELSKEKICCAVSIHHSLAQKNEINIEDLFGENLMIIRSGCNRYIDILRYDILKNYHQINIVDFPFYDVTVFNQCENSNNILMVIGEWENVHPLLKVLKVNWDYVIPFGLLYSSNPSKQVVSLINAIANVYSLKV